MFWNSDYIIVNYFYWVIWSSPIDCARASHRPYHSVCKSTRNIKANYLWLYLIILELINQLLFVLQVDEGNEFSSLMRLLTLTTLKSFEELIGHTDRLDRTGPGRIILAQKVNVKLQCSCCRVSLMSK